MVNKHFNEIIDFAIEREKEAVRFYQELQKISQFTEKQKLLHEFELMEKGHITILENIWKQIRKNERRQIDVPEIQNLHISDYIVESKPTAEMSYQEILITAMKKEETSFALYNDLAEKNSDPGIKKLFLKLASEEAKHKLFFEKIYDDEILSQD